VACNEQASANPETISVPTPQAADVVDENVSGGSVYGSVLDMVFTASPGPMALSEIGEEGVGELGNMDGLTVDRDGVPLNDVDIATEPNSPDKSSSELMLAPER
jgi:hypothetical protein